MRETRDDVVVDVADLVIRYGRGTQTVTAVGGLSLGVVRAQVTAVLGPNGAGKTSTVETCIGYRRPTAGSIRVLGLDPVRDHRQLIPRVGVMLQAKGAWSGVHAREMLTHLARLYAHPLDVDLLLQRLGLHGCGRTPFRRLSGGQQQRLGLAMALVGRPELVFLDEPTAGLDPHGRHATWDLIRELRDAGVSVVLTTHLMDEAEQLADHVYVIDHGRVIAEGSPAQLTSRGAQNSLRFTGPAGLDLTSLANALPEHCETSEPEPGRYLVAGPVDPQVLATVTAWCAGHGVLPEHLVVGRSSLEDVFLELTGRGLRE